MKFLSNMSKTFKTFIAKGTDLMKDVERGIKITIVIVTALALMMVFVIYKLSVLIGMH